MRIILKNNIFPNLKMLKVYKSHLVLENFVNLSEMSSSEDSFLKRIYMENLFFIKTVIEYL